MTISWSTNWLKSRVWTSGKFARFRNLDQPTTANGDRFPARLSFDLPVDKLEIPEVRTLPRHWLESYTVTADSFYPALFACFLCLLAVHSHTLRCIRADLTAVFTVTRFSKLPVPPLCCSDSIAYARIGGRCAGQSAPVRPQLCNSRPTTAYNYDVLAHTSGEALSASC